MAYAGQMIRLFISSTFYDMQRERNVLQVHVFPKLRQFCRERGARFQTIDLRWGVSQEASQDHRTLAICFEEIRRCREVSPQFNFLVLLGERHGSALLPEQIDEYEFNILLDNMSPSQRDAIYPWYKLDENANPPVYVLQPRNKKQYPDYQAWEPVQRYLHTILATACKRVHFDAAAQTKYLASATELEIEEGVFKYAPAEQRPLCIFRTLDGVPPATSLFVEQYAEKHDRLVTLQHRLEERDPGSVYKYHARWDGQGCAKEDLQTFCEKVYKRLKARIEAALERPEQVEEPELEKRAFQGFAERITSNFVRRDSAIAAIETYLIGTAPYPLVVTGPSGSGKSTLLAYIANLARQTHTSAVEESIYIGVTPDSSNMRTLLTNLWYRIRDAYGGLQATIDGEPVTIPTDERAMVEKFPNLLRLARADRPLLLLIDALDQLREGSQRNWIPRHLPPHVRMVVSTLPGAELDTLKQDLPASQVLTLEKMTREQGNDLLSKWLENEAKRTLQPKQLAAVLDAFAVNGLPLYLRLAFEEARRWASYEAIPVLPQDIPGLLQKLFARLGDPKHHGNMLVDHALGYLHAARNGLSEDEMLDLLSEDNEVLADIKEIAPESPDLEQIVQEVRAIQCGSSALPEIDQRPSFPVVLWSRLFFDLNPYLTERSADGANLVSFYHQQLGEVVESMYLTGDAKQTRHRGIAQYFAKQPLVNGATPNLRKMSELPFQQTEARMFDEAYETLTDFRFLEQKAATGKTQRQLLDRRVTETYTGVYQLQEDLDRLLGAIIVSRHSG